MVVALQHLSRVCCELDLRWLTVFVFHCVPILTRPPPSPSAPALGPLAGLGGISSSSRAKREGSGWGPEPT